jgi:hypothetical protein
MRVSRNGRRFPSDDSDDGLSQADQNEKLLDMRLKVRELQMIRAIGRRSIDGSYDEYISTFNLFKTADQRYQDQIASEIAGFKEPGSILELEFHQLTTELVLQTQKNQVLTEKLSKIQSE